MRTECVTKVWEFYRDNCDGFKEPMRKEMRKLDDYVASIEADNAKLRDGANAMRQLYEDELKHALAENAKLRDDRDGWKKVCVDQEVMHVMHEDALDNEIAKLRELVHHMHTCMEHYEMDGTISCDRCPLDNDTGNCDFERRMSELGVDE